MKIVRLLTVSLGCASLILPHTLAYAQLPASITSPCGELAFDSFPPNQLLRSENSDGSIVSVLQSGKIGTWGEFFIDMDHAGTYRINVHSRKGPDEAIYQLIVDGDPVGPPVDCYSAESATTVEAFAGDVTFQKAGTHAFRFLVAGKIRPAAGYRWPSKESR